MEASLKASAGTEALTRGLGVCVTVDLVSERWVWLAGA